MADLKEKERKDVARREYDQLLKAKDDVAMAYTGFNAWYESNQFDEDDDDSGDDELPPYHLEEHRPAKRSRVTPSESTSNANESPVPASPVTRPARYPHTDEEAPPPATIDDVTMYYTRARENSRGHQRALNRAIGEAQRLFREKQPVPEVLGYAMAVFNSMDEVPAWKKDKTLNPQRRKRATKKKSKTVADELIPYDESAVPSSSLVPGKPKRQAPTYKRPLPDGLDIPVQGGRVKQWTSSSDIIAFCKWMFNSRREFQSIWEYWRGLRVENGRIFLPDIRAWRMYVRIRPSATPTEFNSGGIARHRFLQVLAEILATPEGYVSILHRLGDVAINQQWQPARYNGSVANLSLEDVARFLAQIGLSRDRAGDAQGFFRRFLLEMAREFPHDTVDWAIILRRTYGIHNIPRLLGDRQLWYPAPPDDAGIDNWVPRYEQQPAGPMDRVTDEVRQLVAARQAWQQGQAPPSSAGPLLAASAVPPSSTVGANAAVPSDDVVMTSVDEEILPPDHDAPAPMTVDTTLPPTDDDDPFATLELDRQHDTGDLSVDQKDDSPS